jgi:diketogulonate reductase-like aldo/keto reductase
MTDTQPSLQLPDQHVELASGARMPLLGLGTWQITGDTATKATLAALEAGYRHLDTATIYENEAEVGRGLAESGLPREDVFVTTKCPPPKLGHEIETLHRSLEMLGTEYVDLWLIHWPARDGAWVDMWRAFVEARDAGLARDIGVSNFPVELIEQVSAATGVAPTLNQVEWSPLLFDGALLEEHRRRGIAFEGYSALRGGTLEHPVVREIAKATERTPAQVLIRWHLQHQVVVIPKSVHPDRIRSNADVGGFELTAEQMASLDALGVKP